MRTPNHPPAESLSLERVLYALSDPIRLCIVKCLASQHEQTCGGFELNMPKSTMSHHYHVRRRYGQKDAWRHIFDGANG